jgi:hypothetical protein
VGPAVRHRGGAPPGRGRLRRPRQQLLAHPTPRPPDPQGGLSGSSSGRSGMIKLARHLSKKPGAVHLEPVERHQNTGQEQVCPVRRLRRLQPHRTGRGCRPPRVRLARRPSVPGDDGHRDRSMVCGGDGRDPLVGYHQLDQFHEMAGRLGLHGLFVQRRGVIECRGVGERGRTEAGPRSVPPRRHGPALGGEGSFPRALVGRHRVNQECRHSRTAALRTAPVASEPRRFPRIASAPACRCRAPNEDGGLSRSPPTVTAVPSFRWRHFVGQRRGS